MKTISIFLTKIIISQRILSTIIMLLLTTGIYSQQLPMMNTHNRASQSLNGQWRYIVDPYENGYYNYRSEPFDQMGKDAGYMGGYYADRSQQNKWDLLEYNFDNSPILEVPGDWNSQEQGLYNYEGTVWYRKKFAAKEPKPGHRYFLYFGAVNYESHVYLNAKKLGVNIGGFTPFQFEVTNLLVDGDNSLVVKVDNKRHADAVPTLNTDWWNYGGITRDVKIIEVPETYISDYQIQLDPNDASVIKGYIQTVGGKPGQKAVLRIHDLGVEEEVEIKADGRAKVLIDGLAPRLWCPEDPYLYKVELILGDERLQDRIGFRTIRTNGKSIELNGRPIFLRGVCLHEENPLRGGRAFNDADARLLLGWIKEMNGNYARLAHYPHNEYMAQMADEMGILLWEEIPVYWTISWNNKETYKNAENQLQRLINRDKNRASVIIWSMANETPVIPERTQFLGNLASAARNMDSTRLLSAAMETHATSDAPKINIVNDPASKFFDVISFNQYNGWYSWLPHQIADIRFDIPFNKPVIISEFGGGALAGLRGDTLTRWTEDYQAYLYKESLKMLETIDGLAGLTPWVLCDFKSPRRPLSGIQDGFNRKGLISHRGIKKQAFYVMQSYYGQNGLKDRISAKATGTTAMTYQKINVEAPFDMPTIKVPVFPNRIFDIRDQGAVEGGKVINTVAIAKSIAKCNEQGGGIVYVPQGTWLTGAVHLKSNVQLYVDEGATLLFSDNPKDYLPAVHTTWEGMECFNYSPLVYADGCTNISIAGKGTLKAKMDGWLPWYSRPPQHMEALKQLYTMASNGVPVQKRQMAVGNNNMRPHFVQFNRSSNILIEDINIVNSPFWVIHLVEVEGGVVRRVNIDAMGHNNDGCDPEMSRNILIEDCVFKQGDDAVSIKSGRNQDAWRKGKVCENIVVRNCVAQEGNQFLAIGSELSGGVRNVYMTNCSYPYRYKARMGNLLQIKTNHRRGGFVDNIHIENCHVGKVEAGLLSIQTDVLYQWRNLVPTYETRYTPISNIYLKNITAGETRQVPIKIEGDPNLPITNVVLSNITVNKVPNEPIILEHVEGVEMNQVEFRKESYSEEVTNH